MVWTAATIKVRLLNNNIVFISQNPILKGSIFHYTGGGPWDDVGKYEIIVKNGNKIDKNTQGLSIGV